jgi:hypothetical protein
MGVGEPRHQCLGKPLTTPSGEVWEEYPWITAVLVSALDVRDRCQEVLNARKQEELPGKDRGQALEDFLRTAIADGITASGKRPGQKKLWSLVQAENVKKKGTPRFIHSEFIAAWERLLPEEERQPGRPSNLKIKCHKGA